MSGLAPMRAVALAVGDPPGDLLTDAEVRRWRLVLVCGHEVFRPARRRGDTVTTPIRARCQQCLDQGAHQ